MVEGQIKVIPKVACKVRAGKVEKAGKNGVQDVKGDSSSNKLMVVREVYREVHREVILIAKETKKKVVHVSPLPQKKEVREGRMPNEREKKADDKKPKEPVVSTVVLKMRVCCEGCIDKIKRIISETKGVKHWAVDQETDLVTVKGTMDAKTLSEGLKNKLNRAVEIVQPKKNDGGRDKKGKGGGRGGGEKKDK